jgi:L,D-transpeptidase catalytic domain
MKLNHVISKLLIGSTSLVLGSARIAAADGTTLTAAPAQGLTAQQSVAAATGTLATRAKAAVAALSSAVRRLSDPHALDAAFHSYFAFQAAHPDQVKKPFLYFVDYGLPNTEPRGYVFDMSSLRVVDGPFTVAHGRGSAPAGSSIPTRFSNAFGSAATSLGLYLAKATYAFTGHSGGRPYHSIGLRLNGVSEGFNDKALARGVVAHGAPYVTPSRAGTSKGCPAMETSRAQRLLPKLADGGMVFLFAPNSNWLSTDPWVGAGGS